MRRGRVVVGDEEFLRMERRVSSSSIQPLHVFHIHAQCQTNIHIHISSLQVNNCSFLVLHAFYLPSDRGSLELLVF